MAGCALAASTVVAVVVPALLAAFSHVLVSSCQVCGDRPCCSITLSGMPAGTACWIVVRSLWTVFGRELVQRGVVGLELGRGKQLLVGQRVVLQPSDRVAEGHPVGRRSATR